MSSSTTPPAVDLAAVKAKQQQTWASGDYSAIAEHFVEFFERWYGPVHRAFAALDGAGRAALAEDVAELVRAYDRLGEGGPVAIEAEYLEVIAARAR